MPDWVYQYGQLRDGKFVGNQDTKGTRGYADGGSFMVGGTGGTDSQLVRFMASPDERVTVETPAQQRAARQANQARGGGGGHTINISINAKDVESFRRNKQQVLTQFGSQLVAALNK
jgi:hypothetical protein